MTPATTTFASAKVNQLRQRAGEACELPEHSVHGWTKCPTNPLRIVAAFDALRLKPGYVLRAYLFREGGNGNGIVWAMPLDAEFPDPSNCNRLENRFLDPPKPDGALEDYMEAIDGDGTPWSYLSASLLAREPGEFGAMWHGCQWGMHRILGADPWQDSGNGPDSPNAPASAWKWSEAMPTEWLPAVKVKADRITVVFYTYSGYDQEAVVRHTDSYKRGSYQFKSKQKKIGLGGGGYIF